MINFDNFIGEDIHKISATEIGDKLRSQGKL